MKLQNKITVTAIVLISSALCVTAQQAGVPRPQRGPGMGQDRMAPPPVVAVLDANRDGVIDATEIDNAVTALKTLDKNGDGKLTRDELRPPRLRGRGPDANNFDGPRGPRGEGGRRGPGRPPRELPPEN